MNKGWECPKCGKVYAPFWIECTACNETKKKWIAPTADKAETLARTTEEK